MGNVVHQRTQGLARGTGARRQPGGVEAGEQARGDGFGIALDPRDLPGKEDPGMVAQRERLGKHPGRVDVGVAVNLAVAKEFGLLQPGNQAQNPCLLAEFQVVLEADQVVGVGAKVLAAQLHHRLGHLAGARIAQAYGLHGAEAQRIPAAPRQFLDRQAAFEVFQLLPFLAFDCLGGDEGIVEAVVFLFRHGAVDVIGGAFVVAGGKVDALHVDGVGFDDGADGVVKGELAAAGEPGDLGAKGGRGERSGGDDGELLGIERRNLFPVNGDAAFLLDGASHQSRKFHPVDSQGVPAGTALASAQLSRAEPARRISCLSSQGAVFSLSDLSELEQTNSAKSAVWCAGVERRAVHHERIS